MQRTLGVIIPGRRYGLPCHTRAEPRDTLKWSRHIATALKPLLGIFLLSNLALAEPITLSCTLPTQNEDGSALTDLAGLKYFEGTVSGGPYVQVGAEAVTDGALTCSLTLERDPGTYFYVATSYNEAGVESRYSNEATKTVAETPPEPPTGLTAAADSMAYTLQQSDDMLVLYPTGKVVAITECNPYIKITTANYRNGVNLIPKASVEFPPGVSARTLYAQCSSGS